MPLLAIRTMVAFEEAVRRDQGNTFRMWLGRVIPHIGDAYKVETDPFRSHMGASTVGRDCAREVWYSFHWATPRNAEGRMLRLWNRGHMEEARFIALLLTIGCNVVQQDASGRQYKISEAGGHYGGSGDGMADGIPDIAAGTRCLTEFKTHNDKSFTKLAGKSWDKYMQTLLPGYDGAPVAFDGEGVRSAKPDHYIQMQQYMRGMQLAVGVYFAVNKNNDQIYAEIVPYDDECAQAYTQRAIQIVPMSCPPKRISESPGWFGCKFCDHRPVCHLGAPPVVNCRTCEFSEARMDGKWYCTQPDINGAEGEAALDKAKQLTGCAHWVKNSAAFR